MVSKTKQKTHKSLEMENYEKKVYSHDLAVFIYRANLQRLENIAKNQAVMSELGLESIVPKRTVQKQARKASTLKVAISSELLRRSTRNAGKIVDYKVILFGVLVTVFNASNPGAAIE